MNLSDKLNKAEDEAKKFRGFTKTQFRAIYAHLKSLERISDESLLQVELKLFLARLYYKTKRGQSKLPSEVLAFFKSELGNIDREKFKNEFLKYLEAILAYSYGEIRN